MPDRSNPLLKLRFAFVVMALCLASGLFSSEPTYRAIIEVRSESDAGDLSRALGLSLIDSIPELNGYLVEGVASSLQQLRKNAKVLSTELDQVTSLSETAILTESTVALLDPDTVNVLNEQDRQWDRQDPGKSALLRQSALKKIFFERSDVPSRGGVVIAVIDTGVDPLHEMLVGSTLAGKNFIDEGRSTDELLDLEPGVALALLQAGGRHPVDGSVAVLNPSTVALLDGSLANKLNGPQSMYFGHGTMVSGLIHAIAPDAMIMPLKAFDASGRGSSFRIAKAIVYAAGNGAAVINMSFNLDSTASVVGKALDYAAKQETVLVASIGNNNYKVDKSYPASYAKVIGVAATDLNDKKASFSNWGAAADVSAPGVGLISPYPANFYAAWSGTSAAAALVSGEAGLLLSRKDLKAGEATTRIQDRVDHLHDKYDLGKGRINLKSAVKKL